MSSWLTLPVAPLALAGALSVTALASAIQSTIGFGYAIVSVPLLSLMDPKLAPVPQLLSAMPLTLLMVLRERHAIDLRGILWVLGGRLPGAALGVLLLKIASPTTLDLTVAGCVVTAVVIIGRGLAIARVPVTEFVAGIASGVFALVASMGGPPLALLYREEPGETVRATLAGIFSIGLLLTVAARLAAREIHLGELKIAVWLVPPLLLGIWSSKWFIQRLSGSGKLRVAIIVTSSLAAAGLVTRAIVRGL